jgi:hypothetical protein
MSYTGSSPFAFGEGLRISPNTDHKVCTETVSDWLAGNWLVYAFNPNGTEPVHIGRIQHLREPAGNGFRALGDGFSTDTKLFETLEEAEQELRAKFAKYAAGDRK